MDAKPQRPRVTRIYGDENVVPSIAPQKTIHQRHKSSPALSSIANGGGLKAAAKRTAFGDVSNTANTLRPSKDDSVTTNKGVGTHDKLAPLRVEQKSIPLLRPAQRPVSVVSREIGNNGSNASVAPLAKQPLAEAKVGQAANQASNPRKLLAKKSTAVFKDHVQAPVEQYPIELPKFVSSIAPIPPVYSESQPQGPQQLQTDVYEPKLRKTKSKAAVEAPPKKVAVEPLIVTIPSEEPLAVRSDGVYIDDRGEVQIYQFSDEPNSAQDAIHLLDNGVALPSAGPLKPHDEPADKFTTIGRDSIDAHRSQSPPTSKKRLVPLSEPEEYWDEEEYEENYPEEGYVTARSYKSRGENTTGGATTVLFPKASQKSRKELAAASALMEAAKASGQLDDETWDTTMVAEYGDEIFQYMRELEVKMLPNAHYMDNQAEIQWSMRSVLMDWLVQVHHRFGLLPETLFLCCNYIDRFLSCKIVSLGKLQLVGATAIFVAAKYEEINCPSVQEIVYMVDNGYTVDEILKAERFMLSMLQFELGWPGPMSFLRRISKADDYDLETRTLAKYFLELTIMDERFVGSPPSFLAAGAHCLARNMLKKGPWSIEHVYFSNYTHIQLHSLMVLILECCENPQKHHGAIYDKYSDKRYKRASQFVQNELNKGFQVAEVAANHPQSFGLLYEERPDCGY